MTKYADGFDEHEQGICKDENARSKTDQQVATYVTLQSFYDFPRKNNISLEHIRTYIVFSKGNGDKEVI